MTEGSTSRWWWPPWPSGQAGKPAWGKEAPGGVRQGGLVQHGEVVAARVGRGGLAQRGSDWRLGRRGRSGQRRAFAGPDGRSEQRKKKTRENENKEYDKWAH